MSTSGEEYLCHILDEITFLEKATSGLDLSAFLDDEVLQRACVRSLTVIGEAAKLVPDEIRQMTPEIEWTMMARMRDRLVHDYFGVDYEIVLDVIRSRLPSIRNSLADLLAPGEARGV